MSLVLSVLGHLSNHAFVSVKVTSRCHGHARIIIAAAPDPVREFLREAGAALVRPLSQEQMPEALLLGWAFRP